MPKTQKKVVFSAALKPRKKAREANKQPVSHQIIHRLLITSSLLSLPQVELNSPSQGTEGPEMLQTGRSLQLDGGHRVRGA